MKRIQFVLAYGLLALVLLGVGATSFVVNHS